MRLRGFYIGRAQRVAALLLLMLFGECLWTIGHEPLDANDYRYARCGREMWESPSVLQGYFTTCGNLNGDGTFAYRLAGLPLTAQRLVLLSSHIVEDIERLCPQVVILLQGQVCAAAPTASLTARLQGQIWLNHAEPGFDEQRPWAGDAQLLSQTYLRGISQQRIFSSSQPTANCVAVPPTLQDCYVLALQQHKALQDAA